MKRLTYFERSKHCTNPTAKKLLELMEEKQTNLAFNPDVTTKKEFLKLIDQVGPEICLLKTHIDIIEDFDWDLIEQMEKLAKKHRFIIFEDRKFADIGNTALHQYQGGMYKISKWADIVNAHIIPGPGIIDGLKSIGLPNSRGLLLLAEMSSSGNLATGNYTQTAIEWAKKHRDFVIGFICQQKLTEDPEFLHLTPGVKRCASSDALGQQYNTPNKVIRESKSDIIIVGRGIFQAKNPAEEARIYRQEGWDAYQDVLQNQSK